MPLTKSDYVAAIQCSRRLWISARAPERAASPDSAARALLEEGREIGRLARGLFPDGALVEGPFDAALARTRALIGDPGAPALFESAFEHAGVRIRADVLERLGRGFGLREVKSGTSLREHHLDDLVVQLWVLRACGLDVRSVELIQVDEHYRHPEGGIDPARFFVRRDVREDVEFLVGDVAKQVAGQLQVLDGAEPAVEPGPHCRRPHVCPYLDSCRGGQPADWIGALPALRGTRFHDLRTRGISRISEVPDDAPLDSKQRRAVDAHRDPRGVAVSGSLGARLEGSGPPASYLDFETLNPGLPIFPGTAPYEAVPCQWSLHEVDASGASSHAEFLAGADGDPRRAFAESLVDALDAGVGPILVYSAFESTVLEALAERHPDLAVPLRRIRRRLFDLLPVVRAGVYARDFQGSFSLKRVAAALVPGFGYDDLDRVAHGGDAALALLRLVRDASPPEERAALREALLRYCERDTQALVELHASLRRLAG
jgi:hypothetical protein